MKPNIVPLAKVYCDHENSFSSCVSTQRHQRREKTFIIFPIQHKNWALSETWEYFERFFLKRDLAEKKFDPPKAFYDVTMKKVEDATWSGENSIFLKNAKIFSCLITEVDNFWSQPRVEMLKIAPEVVVCKYAKNKCDERKTSTGGRKLMKAICVPLPTQHYADRNDSHSNMSKLSMCLLKLSLLMFQMMAEFIHRQRFQSLILADKNSINISLDCSPACAFVLAVVVLNLFCLYFGDAFSI